LFTESGGAKTHQRLVALVKNADGFSLAKEDLEQRGPGDFFGRKQWGLPDLVMQALKDIKLVERTRAAARELLEKDPSLKRYPLIMERLYDFEKRMHLE
jgi:ATP-dependent DNA helicase RecG